jgi:DNA-binding PadR family transcriptional regulator
MYKEIYRMIVNTQENYFRTYRNTDIQEWATEYKIEREQTSYIEEWETVYVPWIAKVEKVYLITENGQELLKELSDLEQVEGVRGYVLKDNHIILNRVPEETIEGGLRLEWIEAVNELTLEDEEGSIFPNQQDLRDFESVLVAGLKVELREHKQDFDKADRARNLYEQKKEEMKRYISQRVQSIYFSNVED